MKIILLGKNGMLGSMIQFLARRQKLDICALGRTEFDAESDDMNKLSKYINTESCVINCIGAIPQKKPTDDVYKRLNEEFPCRLADFCASHNIPLIHISTNCVFSGARPDMTERHTPDADDVYGRTKARGEPLGRAVVLRCSIIGFERAGSRFGLLEWYVGAKEEVRGYRDHMWNGLTTLELGTTILEIIKEHAFTPRLEHHYSENTLSKYDLLCAIGAHIENPAPIIGVDVGAKHYTLKSLYEHTQHGTIESQLAALFALRDMYVMDSIFEDILLEPTAYQMANPFPHGVCDGVLCADFAAALVSEIKALDDSKWDRYENPFEKKYTLRDKYAFPNHLRSLFEVFQSPAFVKQISRITGHDLLLDTTRNFWGVHKYKAGDKLDIHVDAGFHPTLGLKKQVTLGLYLSQDWTEADGCALELWEGSNAGLSNPTLIKCVHSVVPKYNRMVLFDCNDVAWHGNPDPCAKDGRIFVTISYLSNETNYDNKKVKALFIKRPCDPDDPEKDRCRLLRADPELYKTIYRT